MDTTGDVARPSRPEVHPARVLRSSTSEAVAWRLTRRAGTSALERDERHQDHETKGEVGEVGVEPGVDLGLPRQPDRHDRRGSKRHGHGENGSGDPDERGEQEHDGDHLAPGRTEGAQHEVVARLVLSLASERLADEQDRDQGNEQSEREERRDVEMDAALGARRRLAHPVHVAGGPRGDRRHRCPCDALLERLPVGCAMVEPHADEVDVGHLRYGNAEAPRQLLEEGGGGVEVALDLVAHPLPVYEREHRVDVLGKAHDPGHVDRVRGAGRTDRGGRRARVQRPAADLFVRIGVQSERRAHMQVVARSRQFVHGHLGGLARIRKAAGDDHRTVHCPVEVGVGVADDVELVRIAIGIGAVLVRRQEEVRRTKVRRDLGQVDDLFLCRREGQ